MNNEKRYDVTIHYSNMPISTRYFNKEDLEKAVIKAIRRDEFTALEMSVTYGNLP
jgi:hypothetical protein